MEKLEQFIKDLQDLNFEFINRKEVLNRITEIHQALQLHETQVNSSFFKTKEYPEGDETVINEITVNYSQINELDSNEDNNLKLSICHQGAGFYYIIESKRWAFNDIEELNKILSDFKSKANVE